MCLVGRLLGSTIIEYPQSGDCSLLEHSQQRIFLSPLPLIFLLLLLWPVRVENVTLFRYVILYFHCFLNSSGNYPDLLFDQNFSHLKSILVLLQII